MKFLDVPDYYTPMAHLEGLDFFINMVLFIVSFYGTMIVFIILNALLTAAVCWSMLIICRLLGIRWIDGTNKGYINRE